MSEACRREAEVLRAAGTDRWTDSLRDHVAGCGDCAAAAAVAPWIGRFAKMGDREHILPDPSLIWLKAKLLQGGIDAGRAARPLTAVQFLAYGAVAGGWAALLTWKWNAVESWLRGFTPAGLVQTAARAETLSVSFFSMLLVLASMTVMLALHTILAED